MATLLLEGTLPQGIPFVRSEVNLLLEKPARRDGGLPRQVEEGQVTAPELELAEYVNPYPVFWVSEAFKGALRLL